MPRDITPLVRTLEGTTPGNQTDIYQLLAAWNTSLEAAAESGIGRVESVMNQYLEEVISLTDRAAMTEQVDWEFLAECREAYPPDTGDHLCSAILVNVTSRCVIRTRRNEGVEAIQSDALNYLAAVSGDGDGVGNKMEAATFGWGIDHPEVAVADRTVDRATSGDGDWARAVLEHATVADQTAAIELFEGIVQSAEVDDPLRYLKSLDLVHQRSDPPLPEYWDPADEWNWRVTLSETQRERILESISDTVPAARLVKHNHEFGFDLQRAADEAFKNRISEPIPDEMIQIGRHGDTWHLLDDAGCRDGATGEIDYETPFFEWQYRIGPLAGLEPLHPHSDWGPGTCQQCFETISSWVRNRHEYSWTRETEYDGGLQVTWTPLDEQRWVRTCDICQKPAGATHDESTSGQAACPSCLRTLSSPQELLPTDEAREITLGLDEILDGSVETRAIPLQENRTEESSTQPDQS